MARVSPLYSDFSGGEVSPLLFGRAGTEVYNKSTETCLNWVPLAQGPVERRPATHYITATQKPTQKVRLQDFIYSTEINYVLVIGEEYMNFISDRRVLGEGAFDATFSSAFKHFTPVELATPYQEADLFGLYFAQNERDMYIVHNNYRPRRLTRDSNDSWTITEMTFIDGPYEDKNTTDTTITLSATSGTVTVTASDTVGINGDLGFATTDVNRLIRWRDPANNWTWLTITAYVDSQTVTATVDGAAASGTTATKEWRLGAWSDTTGYPSVVTFHQERLMFGGGVNTPQLVAFSAVGDYNNMTPTAPAGDIPADYAFTIDLSSNTVNAIQWASDHERGLLLGTTGGEWVISSRTAADGFNLNNATAVRTSTYGSSAIAPVASGDATLFVQRAKKKVREMAYVFETDGFQAPDMTALAEHITEQQVVEMAYQQEPHNIIWAVRADGILLGFTYDRGQQVTGWHRHQIGGVSDAAGTYAVVESVASVPNPDEDADDVLFVVKRWINGEEVRYIEYLEPFWDMHNDIADAVFSDSAISYDSETPTATFGGAEHLEGEQVSVLADGAVVPDVTIVNGSFTLATAVSKVHIGLKYNSDLLTLRNDFGARNGTSQGKQQRIDKVTLRVHSTVGGKFGPDFDRLSPIIFRKTTDKMDTAVPLFTGDKEVEWSTGYGSNTRMAFRVDQPTPATVIAMMPKLDLADG